MQRDPDEHQDVARPVIGVGNDYPPSTELALHSHARGQLLHASAGVIAVTTPQGAWVAPPERAVWIPRRVPHAVRMIGAVSMRSLMIDASVGAALGETCRVLFVSPLLHALLREAAELPVEYNEGGRDGLVMGLTVAELEAAPTIPLVVPFPTGAALAARCQDFLERPDARATIDDWAVAMHLNRRSFTRLFRRETGMSFAQWRQQACLAVALPRLASNVPVTTIALDLGYDSPASFSTMFRRALGVPPSRYQP